MDSRQCSGILIILLGLIFMFFPMFTSVLYSVIIGVSLLFLGIASIILGLEMRHENGAIGALIIILGIIGIILGILFAFYVDAVAVLVSIQFYIIGAIMLVVGISGLIIKEDTKGKITALLIILLGIASFFIAVYALAEPIYIAILVGIVLVLEGILMLME